MELRSPGIKVMRIKGNTSYKKILRLNEDGMLYWSRKDTFFSNSKPWKPELLCSTHINATTAVITLTYNRPKNNDDKGNQTSTKRYDLQVEYPMTPTKVIFLISVYNNNLLLLLLLLLLSSLWH